MPHLRGHRSFYLMERRQTSRLFQKIIPRLSLIQKQAILYLTKRHSKNGSLSDCLKNLAVTRTMLALFAHIAWYACISGACGNTGHKKVEKEVNVHVMEACTIH